MQACRFFAIHPVVVSVYPVVFILAHNITRVDYLDLVLPVVALLLLGFAIWLLAEALLGNDYKAALVTTLSMLMLSFFQHFYRGLIKALGSPVDREHGLLLWLVLYLGGLVFICRAKHWIIIVNRFSNLFVVFLLLLSAITCGRAAVGQHKVEPGEVLNSADLQWVRNWRHTMQRVPDIYYIILDGYGRADALKNSYGFDNDAFLNLLRSKGFVVLDRNTSNYADTKNSITSSLNMDYVHNRGYSLTYNKVTLLMRSLGYKHIFVPSGFHLTNSSPVAEMTIQLGSSTQSELTALLLDYSVVGYFLRSSSSLTRTAITRGAFEHLRGARQWHERITRSIEAVAKIPQIQQPTFTFAHIISPHPPYVFNRDGSLRETSTMAEIGHLANYNWWTESALFINQIIHLNRLLETMVTELLTKSSTPPIIILQGDHGTLALAGKEANRDNPSVGAIKERMSNLLALYVPDRSRIGLYDSITPVNVFRVIFNGYFDADYPLLPDKNFWSLGKGIQDVTHTVREQ